MKHLEPDHLPLDTDEPIIVALDSTGLKVTDTGGMARGEKHGKRRRGWIKAHVAVDVETGELLQEVVTDETLGQRSTSRTNQGPRDRGRVRRRSPTTPHQTFQLLDELKNGPEPPGIKTRKNTPS